MFIQVHFTIIFIYHSIDNEFYIIQRGCGILKCRSVWNVFAILSLFTLAILRSRYPYFHPESAAFLFISPSLSFFLSLPLPLYLHLPLSPFLSFTLFLVLSPSRFFVSSTSIWNPSCPLYLSAPFKYVHYIVWINLFTRCYNRIKMLGYMRLRLSSSLSSPPSNQSPGKMNIDRCSHFAKPVLFRLKWHFVNSKSIDHNPCGLISFFAWIFQENVSES